MERSLERALVGVGLSCRAGQGAAGREGPERGRVLDGLRGLRQPVQPPGPGPHRARRLDERAGPTTDAISSLNSNPTESKYIVVVSIKISIQKSI